MMSNMTKLLGEVTQSGLPDTSHTLRIMCAEPGICNHNGTPKPVVTLTPNGLWAYCRWSKTMEFITWEQCDVFRQSCAEDKDRHTPPIFGGEKPLREPVEPI